METEAGVPVLELFRKHAMSSAIFYKWYSKFGGMNASMVKRIQELEAENALSKKMDAVERIKAEPRQEAIK